LLPEFLDDYVAEDNPVRVIPMTEIPARIDDLSRRINHWWSSAIMAFAVRWWSTFSETLALTTQSTSTVVSMLGPAISTNQCRATDSVYPKRRFAKHAAEGVN
jgi:hypothetical protein